MKKDGVSMGPSLRPVLVNNIMTKSEKAIVNDLVKQKKIKFYVRYVHVSLLLVKLTKF